MNVIKEKLIPIGGKFYLFFCLVVFSSVVFSSEDSIYSETKGFVDGGGYIETIGVPSPPDSVLVDPPSIDELSWIKPVDGLYYINSNAINASDSTNGTPLNPRVTIPSIIPAGSYVVVEGEYSTPSSGASGYTDIKAAGNDKIWNQGESGAVWVVGKNAVFTKGVIIEGSYLFIKNVQFGLSNGESKGVLIGSSKPRVVNNVVIRECVFYGKQVEGEASPSSRVVTEVNAANPAENIFMFDNKFYNHGDVDVDYDQDFHMVQVGKGVKGYWFNNNLIDSASGSGIQVIGSVSSTENIYIGSNTITNVRQSGVGIKYGTDIIISQNVLNNIIDTRPLYSVSPSPSKGVGYQYSPQNLWIMYNDISNSSFGVYGGSTNSGDWSVYVVGNYIHDISTPDNTSIGGGAWADAAIMLMGGKYRYIVNNTIRNVDSGIYGPSQGETLYNISQNVIAGVKNGKHVYIESGNSAYFDGNQNEENKSYLLSLLDGLIVDEENSVTWASNSGTLLSLNVPNICESNACFSSSSIFLSEDTSLSEGGAKLVDGVNGHDKGVEHNIYTTFFDLYGLNIEYDIYGNKRTGAWDIGSYESTANRGIDFESVPLSPSSVILNAK